MGAGAVQCYSLHCRATGGRCTQCGRALKSWLAVLSCKTTGRRMWGAAKYRGSTARC